MDTKSYTPKAHKESTQTPKKQYQFIKKPLGLIALLLITTAALYGLFVGYAYTASPGTIRNPKFQHYHFRMQIMVHGQAQNFAEKEYQTDTAKDVCTATITQQPFHFHDDKNQIVHVHWDGMTGGLLLKYYGWNYVGDTNSTMGYRFDTFPHLTSVPIHGNILPRVAKTDRFYVFTGDEHSYKEQSWNNFLHQDFEKFFGVKSNLPDASANSGVLNSLFPKAYAHGMDSLDELEATAAPNATPQELQRVNNLLGNVVIFVQKDHPTKAQIKDRFNKLAPLTLSTCAG